MAGESDSDSGGSICSVGSFSTEVLGIGLPGLPKSERRRSESPLGIVGSSGVRIFMLFDRTADRMEIEFGDVDFSGTCSFIIFKPVTD